MSRISECADFYNLRRRRENKGGREERRKTKKERERLLCSEPGYSAVVTWAERRLSIVSGSLERSTALDRDQSLGVVNEFKCIMGSDQGTVISSNWKGRKSGAILRVNVYTVLFGKASMELGRLSLYCLNVAMAIVSSRSYMFFSSPKEQTGFPSPSHPPSILPYLPECLVLIFPSLFAFRLSFLSFFFSLTFSTLSLLATKIFQVQESLLGRKWVRHRASSLAFCIPTYVYLVKT